MNDQREDAKKVLRTASELFKDNLLYEGWQYSLFRFINYTLLIIFLLALTCSSFIEESSVLTIPNYFWVVLFVAPQIITTFIIYKKKQSHKFFEGIIIEQRKKDRFFSTLTILVSFFSHLCVFMTLMAVINLKAKELGENYDVINIVLSAAYGLIFFLNSIFCVQLHYKIFEDHLTLK